jgi:hypothetical protein
MARKTRRTIELVDDTEDMDGSDALVNNSVSVNGDASADGDVTTRSVVSDEKAEEIWAAVREEYHESASVDRDMGEELTQTSGRTAPTLPSETLRSHQRTGRTVSRCVSISYYRLNLELTTRVDYDAEMKELIHAYIKRRGAHVPVSDNDPITEEPKPEEDTDAMEGVETKTEPPVVNGMTNGSRLAASSASSPLSSVQSPLPTESEPPHTSTPAPSPPPPEPVEDPNPLHSPDAPPSALIGRLAQISSLSLTVADERLNASESALHAIDRHLALLEQAIKDQEAALAIGTRPGTHPAAVVLPTIVAPSARQQPREPEKPSFTIRLPAAQAQDNERFCYCHQASYGEVSSVRVRTRAFAEELDRWSAATTRTRVLINGSTSAALGSRPLPRASGTAEIARRTELSRADRGVDEGDEGETLYHMCISISLNSFIFVGRIAGTVK